MLSSETSSDNEEDDQDNQNRVLITDIANIAEIKDFNGNYSRNNHQKQINKKKNM